MSRFEVFQPKYTTVGYASEFDSNDPRLSQITSPNHILVDTIDGKLLTLVSINADQRLGVVTEILQETETSIVGKIRCPSKNLAVKALKIPKRKEHEVHSQMFLEAEIFNSIKHHPNIIKYVGNGMTTIDGKELPVILTEYIDDTVHLGEYFSTEHPEELLSLIGQTVFAVGHLHTRRIIHADICPDNILVTCDGLNSYLLDFSISIKLANGVNDIQNRPRGHENYAPPEQFNGHYSLSNDIYSLAGVWFSIIFEGVNQFDPLFVYDFSNPSQFKMKLAYKAILDEAKVYEAFRSALESDYDKRTPTVEQFYQDILAARK